MPNPSSQTVNPIPSPASRLIGLGPYNPSVPDTPPRLKLDANEGAIASPGVRDVRIDSEALRRYPSPALLERLIADKFGLPAERIVLTNGGDDAIDRICRAVIEPGRRALLHTPTFEMIRRGVLLAGGEIDQVTWMDGPFPADELLRKVTPDTALISLVTPNNPTGTVVSSETIERVCDAAASNGALVLLDLAYVEFADEDPTRLVLDRDNIVVVRTFSKARGLAGARVGYSISSPVVASWLRTVGAPYPVSASSIAFAEASLADEQGLRSNIENTQYARVVLMQTLEELGCEFTRSQANFVLLRTADPNAFQDALSLLGVSVRTFGGDQRLSNRVRITVPGSRDDLKILVDALRVVLRGVPGSEGGKS